MWNICTHLFRPLHERGLNNICFYASSADFNINFCAVFNVWFEKSQSNAVLQHRRDISTCSATNLFVGTEYCAMFAQRLAITGFKTEQLPRYSLFAFSFESFFSGE